MFVCVGLSNEFAQGGQDTLRRSPCSIFCIKKKYFYIEFTSLVQIQSTLIHCFKRIEMDERTTAGEKNLRNFNVS